MNSFVDFTIDNSFASTLVREEYNGYIFNMPRMVTIVVQGTSTLYGIKTEDSRIVDFLDMIKERCYKKGYDYWSHLHYHGNNYELPINSGMYEIDNQVHKFHIVVQLHHHRKLLSHAFYIAGVDGNSYTRERSHYWCVN